MTFSIAKSYLSVLAGLAFADGLIADIDEPVGRSVDGPHFSSPHNAKITWRHLLNMNSEWQGEIFGKSDQVDHFRQIGIGADNSRKGQRRELREPGSLYEYNDVRVNALGLCAAAPLPQAAAAGAARADHGSDRRLAGLALGRLRDVMGRDRR